MKLALLAAFLVLPVIASDPPKPKPLTLEQKLEWKTVVTNSLLAERETKAANDALQKQLTQLVQAVAQHEAANTALTKVKDKILREALSLPNDTPIPEGCDLTIGGDAVCKPAKEVPVETK